MPNIAQVMKAEIVRLAKKEVKASTAKLRKDNADLKRRMAEHKRRIAKLEKDNRGLVGEATRRRKESLSVSDDEVQKARITAKLIRSIRKKLKLSQAELAKLVGVSSLCVYQWEHKQGRLTFRGASKASIVEVRKLSPAEARERLDGMKAGKAVKGKRRKRR